MIGSTEVLVICGVVVLLFGGAAIPKFARNLGKARKEFEKGTREANRAMDDGMAPDERETEEAGSPDGPDRG